MIPATVQNVVFVGTTSSVFVVRTAEELRRRGVSVQIIDPYVTPTRLTGNSNLQKIRRFLNRAWFMARAIRRLDREQTVVIHSLGLDLFWMSPLLKRRFQRVVGLAYGSDILRRIKRRDWLLRIGLRRLDCIAATNINVRDAIVTDFPGIADKEKRILRFGLPVFDALENNGVTSAMKARAQLGYMADKPLVSLGYSASRGQRQQELIAFFAAQPDLLTRYQFVVPVQYGSPEVQSEIEKECHRVNQRLGTEVFHPLSTFHDPDTAAVMRIATTVLINHSVSDAFSGSVQEVIYAGNMVLAAKHLPYDNMPGFGAAVRSYETLEECASALHPDALSRWQVATMAALSATRAELRSTSSWEGVIDDWYAVIDTGTQKRSK